MFAKQAAKQLFLSLNKPEMRTTSMPIMTAGIDSRLPFLAHPPTYSHQKARAN